MGIKGGHIGVQNIEEISIRCCNLVRTDCPNMHTILIQLISPDVPQIMRDPCVQITRAIRLILLSLGQHNGIPFEI
jgi:hypothetical protein